MIRFDIRLPPHDRTVKNRWSVALYALLCLIWGSTWLVIKVGYGGLGPFNVAAVRFFIAGTILIPLVPLLGARWPRERLEWGLVVLVGLVLFGGLLILSVRGGFRTPRLAADGSRVFEKASGYAAGPVFGIIGLLLASPFDVIEVDTQPSAMLWILITLCLSGRPAEENALI